MKPSLRMLMIEAGIKRLIPQIVSVGKRKIPECPFLAEVQRLGDSKYQGEGVHTELYFSQKQPRALRELLTYECRCQQFCCPQFWTVCQHFTVILVPLINTMLA